MEKIVKKAEKLSELYEKLMKFRVGVDENYSELHFEINQTERELLKEVRELDKKGIEASDYIDSSLIKKAEKGQGRSWSSF